MSLSYLIPAWKKHPDYLKYSIQSIRMYDSSPIIVIGHGKRYIEIYKDICQNCKAILYEVKEMHLFSKSQMLNAAFRKSNSDSVVIYDADFIATSQIVDLWHDYTFSEKVSNFNQLRLTAVETDQLLSSMLRNHGVSETCKRLHARLKSYGLYSLKSVSPPTILPSRIYEEVGGHCEDIIGWGSEDSDFTWMLEMHGCKPRDNNDPLAINSCVFHLFHGANKAGGYALSKAVKMKRREKMQAGEVLKGNEGLWGELEIRKIV